MTNAIEKLPRPLGSQVLIKLVKKQQITSNLILPDSINRPEAESVDTDIVVVKLGAGCVLDIKEGDNIIFRTGTQILSIKGFPDLFIVPEASIAAVI